PQASLLFNKRNNGVDGPLGLFFHDPMTGTSDDGALDVGGDIVQFAFHRGTVGMVPANREQRQGQLADLGEERLVVFAILCERCELAAEGVVHRTRAGIELSVVIARLLVDRRWIGRQIVIETVEQDALATSNQPLDIWAA